MTIHAQQGRKAGKRLLTLLLLLFVCSCTAHGQPDQATPPNILVIVVDDLGQMDIEPNNPDTFYRTPNISRFASQGVRFDNHYSASPVCSPSRFALMTGRNPAVAGATDWFHKEGDTHRSERFKPALMNEFMGLEELTIAERLKSGGYSTAFVGKWHLGEEQQYWPENQGFDINIGGYWSGSPGGRDGYFSPYRNPRLEDGPDGEYLTERLTTETIMLLQKMKRQESPFFIFLSYYTVHNPLGAPEQSVSENRTRANKLGRVTEFGLEEQVWPNTETPRRVRKTQDHPVYAAMVEQMDRNFGRLLEALEDLGIADNTMVIFTSDNGGLSTSEGLPTSNLPFRGGKGWLYEGGIRVPLIIHWPGRLTPGSVNSSPVIAMDIYPTILDSAGVQRDAVDGESLFPVHKPRKQLGQRALYWHYPHYSNQGGVPASAIRVGDYKLIRRLEDGRVHLFDLSSDPGELLDLASQMPDKASELADLLNAWYAHTGARFLNPKSGVTPWRPTLNSN